MYQSKIFKKVKALLLVTVLAGTFQNCSSFIANGPESQSNLQSSTTNPFGVDFSNAESIGSLVALNDFYYQYPERFFGPNHILYRKNMGELVLYNIKTNVADKFVSLVDSKLNSIFAFYELNKIFFTETDSLNGKSYLTVFDLTSRMQKRILEINKAVYSCGAYPYEPRIAKIVCSVRHLTKSTDVSLALIDAQSLEYSLMAETNDNVNLDYQYMQDLFDINYEYGRNAFLYPAQKQLVLQAFDVTSKTIKNYRLSESEVVPVSDTDKSNYWNDGSQITLAQAISQIAMPPNKGHDSICLGSDYSGAGFASAQYKYCTPYGMVILNLNQGIYILQVCSMNISCETLSLADQDIKWSIDPTLYFSKDQSSLIISTSSTQSNLLLRGLFYYDFERKVFKKIVDPGEQINVKSVTAGSSPNLFLLASDKFIKTDFGVQRPQIFFNASTGQSIPAPLLPPNLQSSHTYYLVQDGDLIASIMVVVPDLKTIYAQISDGRILSQSGYSLLSSYKNNEKTYSHVFLQKEVSPGQFEIYEWNLRKNIVQLLFSTTAYAGRGLNGLFSNDKIYFSRKAVDSTTKCESEIRSAIDGALIQKFTSDAASNCGFFGAAELSKKFVFLNDAVYPMSDIQSFDYETKLVTQIGTSKYSGSITTVQIEKTYYSLGNALIDSDGKFISNVSCWLYDSKIGRGNKLYGIMSYRNPDSSLARKVQEVDPVSGQVKDLEILNQSNVYLSDSGFHFVSEKTIQGMKFTVRSMVFNLVGFGFSQKGRFISYATKSSGQWQFVYTDITASSMNQTVISTQSTFSGLQGDFNFYGGLLSAR